MAESEEREKWIDERFMRVDDRIQRIEKTQERISENIVWLVRLGVGALLTLAAHALVSFIQMGGMK